MSERKLFIALNENNERIFIDKLKDKNGKFFCPHCKAEVIPKMGNEKIWHFAHKERVCSFLSADGKDAKEHSDLDLDNFAEKTTDKIEIPEASTYKCKNCGTVGNKKYGVKLDGWYCKECYKRL